jgi:hypothetical protein
MVSTPPPSPTYVNVQDVREWTNSSMNHNRTGFSTVGQSGYIPSNLSTQQVHDLGQIEQKTNALLAQIQRTIDQKFKKLETTLQQRLDADHALFAEIDKKVLRQFCAFVAKQMLIYMPTRIAVDVTTDASVIYQVHYGDLHFYWECFFDAAEPIPYATLNITHNKKILFTKGGDFKTIQQDFQSIITPLFKKAFGNH